MTKHETKGVREVAVFKSNRSQAIRIPKEFAFPDSVKKVTITSLGDGLLIRPAKQGSWAEYFARDEKPHEGFAEEMLRAINEPQPPDDDVSFD